MLNPRSPMPLYHQLAEFLMSKIRSGEYPPGSRIPSEHQLAKMFDIGRPTVRQAVELLVHRQRLERKRGSGTYVLDKNREVSLFSLDGTQASFQREGLAVSTRLLSPMQRKTVDRVPANPFSGKTAYTLSRLIRVEQEAVLVEDMFFDATVFAGIDTIDLQGRSLSEIAEEQYYVQPVRAKQKFSIGYPDSRIASSLEVDPKDPILTVQRYIDFPKASQAFYSELFCRTDRFVFSQTIGGAVYG